MTPGALADRAWKLINQASGQLGGMVIKKSLRAHELQNVIEKLESAQDDLRIVLGARK